jgi:uncharacterized membrane protein
MLIIHIFYAYLVIGFLFAIWFTFLKKNHSAEKVPIGFKLIIIPGCLILWPIVIIKTYVS